MRWLGLGLGLSRRPCHRNGGGVRPVSIRTFGLTPITQLSEPGDLVATHSAENYDGPVTWSLLSGTDVFQIDTAGNVTIKDRDAVDFGAFDSGFDDGFDIGADFEIYVVRAELASGQIIDLQTEVPIAAVIWSAGEGFVWSAGADQVWEVYK